MIKNKKARLAGRAESSTTTNTATVPDGAGEVNVFEPRIYSVILRDKRLSHGAFRVWHLLRDYCGTKGYCWPSVRTLRRLLGSSPTTVTGWLDELVDCGYVRRHSPNKARKSNTYQLLTVTETGNGTVTETGNRIELSEPNSIEVIRVAGATDSEPAALLRPGKAGKPETQKSYEIRMQGEFAEIERQVEDIDDQHALESFEDTLSARGWLHSDGSRISNMRLYFVRYVESRFPTVFYALPDNLGDDTVTDRSLAAMTAAAVRATNFDGEDELQNEK